MVTKTRLLIREITVYTAHFIWFFAVSSFLAYWAYKTDAVAAGMGMLAVPFMGHYLVRRYCKRITLFLLCHLLISVVACAAFARWPAAGLTIPFGGIDVNFAVLLFIAFTGILTVYSLYIRFAKSQAPLFDTGTAVFFVASLAGVCILSEVLGFDEMTLWLTTSVIALLALKYLFTHMYNVDFSMDLVGQTAKQPTPAIRAFNNKLITVFILLMVAVAVASEMFGLSGGLLTLVFLLGRGLREMLRFLLSFLVGEPEQAAPYVPPAAPLPDEETGFMYMEEAYKPAHWLLLLLEQILAYAVIAAVIAAILVAAVYGCYRLYKLFYNRRETTDEDIKESVMPDIKEMVRVRFSAAFGGPVNRVRRLFYRKVRRHMARKTASPPIAHSDTAWEMAKKIKASEDIDALTARYDQARYAK